MAANNSVIRKPIRFYRSAEIKLQAVEHHLPVSERACEGRFAAGSAGRSNGALGFTRFRRPLHPADRPLVPPPGLRVAVGQGSRLCGGAAIVEAIRQDRITALARPVLVDQGDLPRARDRHPLMAPFPEFSRQPNPSRRNRNPPLTQAERLEWVCSAPLTKSSAHTLISIRFPPAAADL